MNEAPSVSVEPPSKKKDADEVFSDEDSIDLEEDVDQHWLQFQGCLLTELDKIAITSNDLLSDRHIHYAQAILSQQFPHVDGFKNTLLQGKPQLRKIQCGGIQIIHDRGNHWIVASAIGNKDTIESVQVYDSIFSCVAKATVDVIKNLFMVTDATRIEVMQMKHQTGSRDCGIFAIAVSTALLHGINVSNITFCQDKMRQHLHCTVLLHSQVTDSVSSDYVVFMHIESEILSLLSNHYPNHCHVNISHKYSAKILQNSCSFESIDYNRGISFNILKGIH